MPRDSNGNYLRPANSFSNPVPQTTINSTDADALFDDFETALNNSAVKNPEYVVTTATAMLPNERVLTAGAGISIAATSSTVTVTADAATDPELSALASVTSAADQVPYFTGPGTATTATLTTFGRTILDDPDATTVRATIGAQPVDADLTSLAGATASGAGPSPSGLYYRKAPGNWAALNLVNLVIDDTTDTMTGGSGSGGGAPINASYITSVAETGLTNERVLTGTTTITWDFATVGQAKANVSDPELAAIAGLTSAADQLPYFTGSGTAALTTLTAAARSVLDDTSTANMLTTLGGQPLDADLTSLAAATAVGGGPTPSGLYYRRATNDWQPLNLSGITLDVGTNTLMGSPSTVVGDTPPSSPAQGQLWWESDSGLLFISYNDGNTTQWVSTNSASGGNVSSIPTPANDQIAVWTSATSIEGTAGLTFSSANALTVSNAGYNIVLNPAGGGNVNISASGTPTDVGLLFSSQGGATCNVYTHSYSSIVAVFGNSGISNSNSYVQMWGALNGTPTIMGAGGTPNSTVNIRGTTTNDDAPSGYIGEYLEHIPGTNSIAASSWTGLAAINLTPGDWDVWGNAYFGAPSGAGLVGTEIGSAPNTAIGSVRVSTFLQGPGAGAPLSCPVPPVRVRISANATYWLNAFSALSNSDVSAYIAARRVR